jgi:hypothetical protein
MENLERSIELPKDHLSRDVAEIVDGLSAQVAGAAKDAVKRLRAIGDKETDKSMYKNGPCKGNLK